VPVFDSIKGTTSFKPWAWYPILFVPLTAVILVVYFFWITHYKSKSQKEVDKCEIYKPPGMKAVSLTTVGNV
jgi:glucose uptake protein GlcU